MKSRLFDSSILATAQQAVEFVSNILESSTEYSVIGKDLDGRSCTGTKARGECMGTRLRKLLGSSTLRFFTLQKTSPPEIHARSWRQRCAAVSGKALRTST